MTVTTEHKNNHRKRGSWDSKMSVSSVGTTGARVNGYGRNGRCGTPSSILSSDSDIRFTRKKLSSQLRCGCCLLASFLTFLLFAVVALYLGYIFYLSEGPSEQIFRGMFRVIEGDTFNIELADPSTEVFRIRSKEYTERLNLLFRDSGLRPGFLGTEVLALDGEDGKDLIVHFDLHFDPRIRDIEIPDLLSVLSEEIRAESSPYFKNITIDASSIDLKKSDAPITSPVPLLSSPSTPSSPTTTPVPPRKCRSIELNYCKHLPYNKTSYPNILGHRTIKEVQDDVITFRELVDAECYRKAYEFVCQLLQPACTVRYDDIEDEIQMPCRSFCRDFLAGCGNRLPDRVKNVLDCSRFPEFSGIGSCRPKPGCVQEMQVKAQSPRMCDGIVDCEDISDETSCSYCPKGYLHCGIGRKCIPHNRRCDGKEDCPDGSDERACLIIAPSIKEITKYAALTPHIMKYYYSGFAIFNEKGEYGKICTENIPMELNGTEDVSKNPIVEMAATSLCKAMSFQKLEEIEIIHDSENNVPYVQMKNPPKDEISFVRSNCPSNEVLHVTCSNLECGKQPVHPKGGIDGFSKMSGHGDWPWHAALFKEDVHICDGTLISAEWIATTASCFQGQPKSEWIVKFGVIRLDGFSPWQQIRRIIGTMNSPVEGSTIIVARLDEPVYLNDFVRPICLPKEEQTGILLPNNMTMCNTLGWSRNREQLQRVQVKITTMERCENVSIATLNSLCTESTYLTDDCNEEEFAGSPMLCLLPDQKRWSLVGISNWRIACSKSGVDRPRMYDKITSNIEWIQKTISAIT